MNASILSIGDELLIGQTVNTNASWIGNELNKLGYKIKNQLSISDDLNEIINSLDYLSSQNDVIIITGGLGPTKDDITKTALCKYFGAELVLDSLAFDNLEKYYQERGRTLTETNISQAYVPNNAKSLQNSVGAAPGTFYDLSGKYYFSLPGVPKEMKAIFTENIFSILKQKIESSGVTIYGNKLIYTTGIPESTLSDLLEEFEANNKQIKLAYLPSFKGVKLRIDTEGINLGEINSKIDDAIAKIKVVLFDYFIDSENDILTTVVNLLKEKKIKISVAESCTGGMLGQQLTTLSGSSNFFEGGIISYSNEIKNKFLNVSEQTLSEFGAVSEETAFQMALNCRIKFNTDYAISITGIAGPNSDYSDKPVGTVYIGIASKNDVKVEKFIFGKEREMNRELSCTYALKMLYNEVLNKINTNS